MPQLHLPMFPAGVTHITNELAFERRDGKIAYFNVPERIASVITLGSPFRGLVLHRLILALSNAARRWIRNTGPEVPRECASSRCGCAFGQSLGRSWPRSVRQTAVYTKCDGMVDWRYCLSGKPDIDVEVVGTHLGLPFNATVFGHIAARLAPRGAKAKIMPASRLA